jgi:dihydroorotate dehydrogenase
MLKMKIVQHEERFNQYVLASGFDVDGEYLNEISLVGFGGIEVGPISLNPTSKE